jgi:5-formaminoimidazole-4-carboxamide-1-(beta)-D-ribofuranosyl 5'-monophosphate synthetase
MRRARHRVLGPKDAASWIAGYDRRSLRLGVTGSHSALDVCDGAADEGVPNVAFCQRGRDATYSLHFRTVWDAQGARVRGCVDRPVVLTKFSDQLAPRWQKWMQKNNVVYVPNRSFTSYCDIERIENEFRVPLLGSRNLLRIEEREEKGNYYELLRKAGIAYPERIQDPARIRELAIVKLHHKTKRLERGFFTCASHREFREKSGQLLKDGVIAKEDLASARIERYVIGPVLNCSFFYSPLTKGASKLELLGVDWRFESSLDGHVRIPAPQQLTLPSHQAIPEMTVVGHNSATIRESLLEKVFAIGEKFVAAAAKHYRPGILGPFCLQTVVDKDMKFYVYDVAPRIGGGTNVHVGVGHPYGNALWRRPMSTGRRVALELKRAVEADALEKIVT